MDSNAPHEATSPKADKSASSTLSVSLRSGTGAPIFEHGPHTRIRRNPVRAIAAITWEDGPREAFGQLLNVSLTGCLIRTESTIEIDTELALRVTLAGSESDHSHEIYGVVRRATTVDGRRAYGIEFLTPSQRAKEAVQDLYSETAR